MTKRYLPWGRNTRLMWVPGSDPGKWWAPSAEELVARQARESAERRARQARESAEQWARIERKREAKAAGRFVEDGK